MKTLALLSLPLTRNALMVSGAGSMVNFSFFAGETSASSPAGAFGRLLLGGPGAGFGPLPGGVFPFGGVGSVPVPVGLVVGSVPVALVSALVALLSTTAAAAFAEVGAF